MPNFSQKRGHKSEPFTVEVRQEVWENLERLMGMDKRSFDRGIFKPLQELEHHMYQVNDESLVEGFDRVVLNDYEEEDGSVVLECFILTDDDEPFVPGDKGFEEKMKAAGDSLLSNMYDFTIEEVQYTPGRPQDKVGFWARIDIPENESLRTEGSFMSFEEFRRSGSR